jgi:hypothetical protein
MRGITDNLNIIFGSGHLFEGMLGRTIDTVALSADKAQIVFRFQDGGEDAMFEVEGDCCSTSWIEHLEVPNDVKGAVLTDVANGDYVVGESESEYEEVKVYSTSFKTTKGEIILEFRNSSNGYYGGYLVRK